MQSLIKRINLIFSISTTIIGTIIAIYILINCNIRLYYYHIYKGITSGLVINISYYVMMQQYLIFFDFLLKLIIVMLL